MTKQNALTLVTPVSKDITGLMTKLEDLKKTLLDGKELSFEKTETVHYLRWLVIDYEGADWNMDNEDQPKLVFCSNFDGSLDDHLRDLATESADILNTLYSHCDGFPGEDADVNARIQYLSQWKSEVMAFYVGAPGRTVGQIRNERKLHNYIRDFLNSKDWSNNSATEVHQAIKSHVFNSPEFQWAKTKVKYPKVHWLQMILLGLFLLVMLPFIILWVLYIHFFHEVKDQNFDLKRSQLNDKHILELETYEDLITQNQFSQICIMKKGPARLATFTMFMWLGRKLISILFQKGELMGIPTIHFARWVLFDNKKRVLFFSNFDGSWQQYLGDFIDQSGWGLTGIFSNTTNFPKTNFLLTGGAYDEEHFLAWSRSTQIPTQIWYTAYPDLSIKNVNNNTQIRIGLTKSFSEKQATNYLKLI